MEVTAYLNNNGFHTTATDPTKQFQTEVRKNLNSCPLLIPTDKKWKYVNLNPKPPHLQGLIKIHKPDAQIRPIINRRTAPRIN
jgi:hypothetical protein